jgi:hypothetical protein
LIPRKLATETFENYQKESELSWTSVNSTLAELRSSLAESIAEITESQSQGQSKEQLFSYIMELFNMLRGMIISQTAAKLMSVLQLFLKLTIDA